MKRDYKSDTAQITRNILEFYQLQPGVRGEQMEKLEEFMVLSSAFYLGVMEELESLENEEPEDVLEEVLDQLNGYLNALGEEWEKIFPDLPNVFHPISVLNGFELDFLQFVEAIRSWNGGELDRFGILDQLQRMDESTEEQPEPQLFHELIHSLVDRVHMKFLLGIEDLL